MSVNRAAINDIRPVRRNRLAVATLVCGLAIMGTVAIAQDTEATPTPAPPKPVFGGAVSPPGFRSPKARPIRGMVTPAVFTPRAAVAATAAAAAKSAVRLPKPIELSVKSKPGHKAVSVTWKSQAPVTTLTLERAESEAGPFNAVAILASNEGSFDDENSVFPGTTYYYRLISQFAGYEGGLVSPLSSPVQVVADKLEGTNLDSSTTGSAGQAGKILPSHSDKKSSSSKSAQ